MHPDEELPLECDFYHHGIMIVSGANMSDNEELKIGIKNLNSIIDTGYYEDVAGNELMKHIREYLRSKLDKE